MLAAVKASLSKRSRRASEIRPDGLLLLTIFDHVGRSNLTLIVLHVWFWHCSWNTCNMTLIFFCIKQL